MAACEANPNATRAEFLQTEQGFHPSQHLLISCGTVPVDPHARKIAILRDSADGTVSLPKGRKNIGEDLLAAALRETREETGLGAEALPLLVATRATPAPELAGTFPVGHNPDVTNGLRNCEPSSVCVYPCIFTGALKMVFWFASRVEERQAPDEVRQVPWDANVRLDWVEAREAAALMTFKADGQVVEKVLEDMRNSGYGI